MICDISQLPDDLAVRVADQPLIIFDGECVLCSAFYRFVLRCDPGGQFAFDTAQSEIGQALYMALDLPHRDFETNLVILGGQIYMHLDSFAAVMSQLRLPWRALSVLSVLPQGIKTPLYRVIARNRFRVFGRYDTCPMPSSEAKARFIDGGF